MFKRFIFIITSLFLLAPSLSQADRVISIADLDANSNGKVDPLDLVTAVAQAPPGNFQFPGGYPAYKLDPQTKKDFGACIGPIILNGFVESVCRRTDEVEGVWVSVLDITVLDITLKQLSVLIVRRTPEGMTQNIVLFFYLPDPCPTEEEIKEAIASSRFPDPNHNGIPDLIDAALVSKFLPTPRLDYDPDFEEQIKGYYTYKGIDPAEVAQYHLAAATTSSRRLTTTWAEVKR